KGHQKDAHGKLRDQKPEEAAKHVDRALDELEKARKFFDEIVCNCRHAEKDRLLTSLLARCERMLAMQTAVHEGTGKLDQAVGGGKPTREQQQQAVKLAGDQAKLLDEAKAVVKMLEDDGSAVAFVEFARMVRDDVGFIEKRLARADVGAMTQNM